MDSFKMPEYNRPFSPSSEWVARFSQRLATDLDRAISDAIDRAQRRPVPLNEALKKSHWEIHPDRDIFVFDGKPLLEVGPVEVKYETGTEGGKRVVASRKVRPLA